MKTRTLNRLLSSCLKKRASMMVFAEAGGEPVRLRMPLLLAQ
jgi:hypothetical protein